MWKNLDTQLLVALKEAITSANVAGFQVPLGNPIRRVETPAMKTRKKRKRCPHCGGWTTVEPK